MFLFTVAWRNLWRHRRRSLITAAAMGVGMALVLFVIALTDGMYSQMFDVMVTQNLGHVQVHHPDYPERRRMYDTVDVAGDAVAKMESTPGVTQLTTRVFGFALAGSEDKSAGARLVGVLPDREQGVTHADQRVVAGRFLGSAPAREVVIGDEMAEELDLEVGGELVVIGQSTYGAVASDLFTIVGLHHTGSTAMDRSGVYLHQADLQAFLELPDQVHEIVVITEDAFAAEPVSAALAATLAEDAPPSADAEGADGAEDAGAQPLVRTWQEADPQAAQLIGMQDASKFIMMGVVFSVAGLGVLNTMLMAVFERTRELGVMRALGLTPGQLLRLVLIESVLLTAVAGLFGLALGGVLDYWVITEGLDFSAGDGKGLVYQGITLDPRIKGEFNLDGVLLTIAVMFSISVLSAVWPAVRAARLRPVDAMRHV